jgi:hypothetical protein
VSHNGFDRARSYPLWDALFTRRTRRVATGTSFKSGSLSFTSQRPVQPLSALEEAMLIAATGITGLALADNPYQTEQGKPLLGTPLLEVRGRSAGSPDNAQSTFFFMWNDEGTYFLRPPEEQIPAPNVAAMTAEELIAYVARYKVKIKDGRVDFPRAFPAYASGNRYVSNVPGSTMLVPVTEVTRQYINGLMYVLAQEEGQRPVFVDDFNLFLPCGCEKWIKSGFLNRDLKLPLSLYGKGRTEYESLLLLQNLALLAQAMGLGAWIHAAFAPVILFGGYPDLGAGLKFRFHEPGRLPLRPYPAGTPNPVGLDGVLQAYCPPYYRNMDHAIDTLLEEKYGAAGKYTDPKFYGQTMPPDTTAKFLKEAPHVEPGVVDCVRAICNYIYRTYDRFPAHANAIDSSGVWIQFHHVDHDFYDEFFPNSLSSTQRDHEHAWHADARITADVEDTPTAVTVT